MLLGFKRRFAPLVQDGSKTHTIRGKRKIRPCVGETAHCYVDPRQKSMMLLGRFPVIKVQDILIELLAVGSGFTLLITIDDVELSDSETVAFAYADGFRSSTPVQEMKTFWIKEHGVFSFPFHGDLIIWGPIRKDNNGR